MSQDPNHIGLLPPPPLLPNQPLPLPVSQYAAPPPSHYPPPLPPPPLQPVYRMQYPASTMQPSMQGYLNPYHQSVPGISTQSHYNMTPAAAQVNPVNQAQAIYAAASQMMIGNMMRDHMSSNNNNKRRKKRSGSPKRRMRSRSDSPQRNKRARDGKRRRNRSPTYKRSYNRGSTSPQKVQRREEKKSEEMKKDLKIEENDENLYQPPTPEENVVAVEAERENYVPDGNRTPDYKADDGTPKTPEYDAVTGSAVTPPRSASQQITLTSSSQDNMTSSNNNNQSDTSPPSRKTAVKPTQSLSPKMISLKKIGDTPDCPVPDVGIKSLADILREQALKSMKRKPTPERESERESESVRSTRDVTPDLDNFRTRAESPTLDRSTTETAKLVRPFDDIDRNMFKPENNLNSDEDDFYSDDEFDPKKYEKNSEDELLDSPERKHDFTGITMNFKVTPKVTKDEKRKAKIEKKRAKELKKKKKEEKKLKKLIKKQGQADNLETETSPNISDRAAPAWQRRLISSHLTGADSPATNSPDSSPPSTPDNDDSEFLKTPEKCDQIFFETSPTEEPRPKRKSTRKVIVLNKDPTNNALQQPEQPEVPEPKPEVKITSPSARKPLAAVFSATIRSLVPTKAEQSNTVSTTANRQVKGFNPFAPSTSQLTKPTPAPAVPSITPLVRPTRPDTVPLIRPTRSDTRKVAAEVKQTRRLGGVKTIKIRKTVPTAVPTAVPEQRVTPAVTSVKPVVKLSPPPIDDDLDDLDKELDLLNAALDIEPASFKSKSKPETKDDDDDLFADIEEFLNEERRNL